MGGRYVLPALYGHFLMVDYWRKEFKRKYKINLSVAFLEYGLFIFLAASSRPLIRFCSRSY